jgi:hypothetical protein
MRSPKMTEAERDLRIRLSESRLRLAPELSRLLSDCAETLYQAGTQWRTSASAGHATLSRGDMQCVADAFGDAAVVLLRAAQRRFGNEA